MEARKGAPDADGVGSFRQPLSLSVCAANNYVRDGVQHQLSRVAILLFLDADSDFHPPVQVFPRCSYSSSQRNATLQSRPLGRRPMEQGPLAPTETRFELLMQETHAENG